MSAATSPRAGPLADEPRAPWRPGRGFVTVMGWAVRENLRLRRLVPWLLATLLLAVGASVIVDRAADHAWIRRDVEHALWIALDEQLLQVLVPLMALLLVGPSWTREVRQRTLVYLLVRPVSRTTVFLARFAGGLLPAALFASVLLAGTALFSDVQLPATVWYGLPVVAGMAVLSLGALYAMLAAIFRRGLVAALIYTFLVEVVIAGLPGRIQAFSVRFHLRSLYHGLLDGPFAEVSPDVGRALGSGATASETNALVEALPFESVGTALGVLGTVTAVALALAILHVRRRDFPLKD